MVHADATMQVYHVFGIVGDGEKKPTTMSTRMALNW